MELEILGADRTQEVAPRHILYQRVIKRWLDFLFTFIVLIFLMPLLLLLALAIKLHSPGPVFYKQERIGKDGRPFFMYKFRTMKTGNHSDFHKKYVQNLIRNNISPAQMGVKSLKMTADPRITRIGKLLRQFSVDEIPQLINVLRGEMTIVGPRPPLPYEFELYSNWHKQRLYILPGITGLWQVKAHNLVSFEEMVHIDLYYINNLSLWLDLKIMLLTPWEMIKGKGSG